MRPLAKGSLSLDGGPVEIRAFPGNVVRISPAFLRQVSVFGRIVDAAVEPVGGASILQQGKDPYRIDESGYFVLDIRADARALMVVGPEGNSCEFSLPDDLAESPRSIVDLGVLVCTPAEGSDLFAEN